MADQPILGSVAWMNQSMRTVHPVYDNQTILAPEEQPFTYLTDDAGNILVSDVVPPVGNLVRWI